MRNENDEKFKRISQFKYKPTIEILEKIIDFDSNLKELIVMIDGLEISEKDKILIKNKISEMKELLN